MKNTDLKKMSTKILEAMQMLEDNTIRDTESSFNTFTIDSFDNYTSSKKKLVDNWREKSLYSCRKLSPHALLATFPGFYTYAKLRQVEKAGGNRIQLEKPNYLRSRDGVRGRRVIVPGRLTAAERGIQLFCDDLGVKQGEIEAWASNNKEIWGNKYGRLMFLYRCAYNEPRNRGYLTLQNVIQHWRRIANEEIAQ